MQRRPDILGLDVGGTYIKVGVVSNGRIVVRGRIPSEGDAGPKRTLARIREAIAGYGASARRIGIGIAGIVDHEAGVVRYSPNLKHWRDIPLRDVIQQDSGRRVRVLNDVNAVLMGEVHCGVAKGCDDVFLLTLGTGVGGAALCGGRLVTGAHGFAGEFGHVTIKHDGPRCRCGNYGCLERYVGAQYVVERARRRMARTRSVLHRLAILTPETIARAARSGDKVARRVFDETGELVGIGVSIAINLFDPRLVVVAGGMAGAGPFFMDAIRRTARRRVMGDRYRHYRIVRAALGEDAGVLGAAVFAARRSASP